METIKLYRNIKVTLKNFYSATFIAGIMIILLLCFVKFLFQYSAELGFVIAIFLILLCVLIGILVYASKNTYQTYKNRALVTLEIREEGFRYPYYLNDSTIILWKDIQQLEMVEFGAKSIQHYIIVELKNEVWCDNSAKENYVKSYCDHFQKNYSGQILVIPELISSDYSLNDLMGLLRRYWKHHSFEQRDSRRHYSNHNYLYEKPSLLDSFQKLVIVPIALIALFCIIKDTLLPSLLKDPTFTVVLNEFSIDTLIQAYAQKPEMMKSAGLIVLVVIMAIYVMYLVLRFLLKLLRSKTAIVFSHQGVAQINSIVFYQVIPWQNVKSIDINRTKDADSSKLSQLLITFVDNDNRQKKMTIKNELQGITIFELKDVLESHRVFNGY